MAVLPVVCIPYRVLLQLSGELLGTQMALLVSSFCLVMEASRPLAAHEFW